MKRLTILLLLILLLSGCAALDPMPAQPAPPSQQEAAPNQPAADSPEEADPTPTDPALPESPAPTDEPPASQAEPEPEAPATGPAPITETSEIAILRPGQLSRVASPFRLAAYLSDPTIDRATITLYGENGRELVSLVKRALLFGSETTGNLVYDLEFEIEALAETGRLEIKTLDGYGRVTAVNSVWLILLSMGDTDRNYALEDGERIALQLPLPTTTEINGSPLLVSGTVRLTPPPENTNPEPLRVQLVNQAGTIVGESQAPVVLTPGSAYGQFVAEVPFQVDTATPVLLTISIREGRNPGMTYLKSYPLTLIP